MSANFRSFLKMNFLNKFFDQPIGAELDLITIFIFNNLHTIRQYIFAWKEKTLISRFFIKIFIKRIKQTKYLILLPNFFQKFVFGEIILIFLSNFF